MGDRQRDRLQHDRESPGPGADPATHGLLPLCRRGFDHDQPHAVRSVLDDFCKHIGAPELRTDDRFLDAERRSTHADELRAELSVVFGRCTRDEWADALATFEGPWAPVRDVSEVMDDPQVIANRFVCPVPDSDLQLVRAPFTVGRPQETLPRGPELGEHTEVLLLEAGHTWEEIVRLKDAGVIT
ncbi:CoA transferase [Prescottella defluvii]|nr:CoA transferase [Prescottella defluvii]